MIVLLSDLLIFCHRPDFLPRNKYNNGQPYRVFSYKSEEAQIVVEMISKRLLFVLTLFIIFVTYTESMRCRQCLPVSTLSTCTFLEVKATQATYLRCSHSH